MKGNKFSAIQIRAIEAAGLDVSTLSEKKKGLWDNIHAKRKRGEKPAKKGDKDYPETLNVEEVKLTEKERVLAELYKGKHGQTEKQYQDSRSDAGKMVSGDSKMSGSKYAQGRRTGSDAGPQPAGGSKKPASQGKMDSGSRIDLQFRKAALKKKNEEVEYVEEARTNVRQNGNIYIVGFTWLGKYMMMKLFFPEVHRPSRKEAQIALDKIYPGARMQRFDQAPYNPSEPMLYMGVQEEAEQLEEKDSRRTVDAIRAYDKSKDASRDATDDSDEGKKGKAKKERAYAKKERGEIDKDDPNWKHKKYHTGMHGESVEDGKKKSLTEKSAAWQRKEGKNKKGGLNEKGRKSYERENPGSDLKAPQPEGGPRKKSFCARMGGVKGPMKKPNGEPTRKALALRKWKC